MVYKSKSTQLFSFLLRSNQSRINFWKMCTIQSILCQSGSKLFEKVYDFILICMYFCNVHSFLQFSGSESMVIQNNTFGGYDSEIKKSINCLYKSFKSLSFNKLGWYDIFTFINYFRKLLELCGCYIQTYVSWSSHCEVLLEKNCS